MEHKIIFSDAFIAEETKSAQYKSVKTTAGNISIVYTVRIYDGIAVFSIGIAEKQKAAGAGKPAALNKAKKKRATPLLQKKEKVPL